MKSVGDIGSNNLRRVDAKVNKKIKHKNYFIDITAYKVCLYTFPTADRAVALQI